MISAPPPGNEAARVQKLRSYGILDTQPEDRFDRITQLIARYLDVPISLVSLVDTDRQWFKSRTGLDAEQTPRDIAFCSHAILGDEPLVVDNALEDERFADNPLVSGAPDIRFYAGAPLITSDGFRLGTLCAIDRRPRQLTEDQLYLLNNLAAVIIDEIELSSMMQALDDHAHALEEKNKALDGFSHALSHDLSGPVRRIRSFCEILESDDADLPVDVCVEHIRKSAQHAESLMADLRGYFGIDSDIEIAQCSVQDCLDSALDTLALDLKAIEAKVDVADLPEIDYYPSLLTTLFQNLVSNSIKYRSDDQLEIKVRSEDAGGDWIFSVEDNGSGIATEHHESVFDLLVRVNPNPEIPGTGLGLAICRKIIRRSGGDIRVASKEGPGTKFVFEIPKVPAQVT